MGTKSRETIYGSSISASAERAKEALKQAPDKIDLTAFDPREVICSSCQSVAARSLATSGKSLALLRASRALEEGRIATVTNVGLAGCGGRWRID